MFVNRDMVQYRIMNVYIQSNEGVTALLTVPCIPSVTVMTIPLPLDLSTSLAVLSLRAWDAPPS
jgi:hypothetical protein